MDLFNLDRAMVRSKANARNVRMTSNVSAYSLLLPANDRRLSLMIAIPFVPSDTCRLYLKCDGPDLAPSSFTYGVMLWAQDDRAYYGANGTITPATDAGAVQTFSLVNTNEVPPDDSTLAGTGTFANTLTPVWTIDAANSASAPNYKSSPPFRLTLRDDGDLVRLPWHGCWVSASGAIGNVLVCETIAADCCVEDYSDNPWPKGK